MINIDSYTHTRGESVYIDDIPLIAGTLFGAVFASPVAHGHIKKLSIEDAYKLEGVVKVFTCENIKGVNQIGGIVPDEPLLADKEVHFRGMPIAFVVAETYEAAQRAVTKIKVDIEPLPVITDPREAHAKGNLIVPARQFKTGDVDGAWAQCKHIFSGVADTNGQEHLYIETQGAYAVPQENGYIKIYSSTQSPRATQTASCKVTGLAMHQIEVEVTRLGGGFGGKEDQANPWAAMCAMATQDLKRPVKYCLHRMEDMAMTGKRHPYSTDYKIGLDDQLRIVAYEVTFYQNAGASADLSPAVLERTLFHCTNAYFIPNVLATAFSCRTNLPPNTAFRGFGGPQGMFVIEAAIAQAAECLGVDKNVIQEKNLLVTGNKFPYGQVVQSEAQACWNKSVNTFQLDNLKLDINQFNSKNKLLKKGYAVMPICFGISFTNTMMNQARALVHVYVDGSITVTTGAVEMGQGVSTKMLEVAAKTFSVESTRVKVQSTSTHKIANTSPSAASATADLNGKAVEIACTTILKRLLAVLAEALDTHIDKLSIKNEVFFCDTVATDYTWERAVMLAFTKRVNLSEHAHYATPTIQFDKIKEKGHPFAYHVFGTAIITATVDCLRGTYEFDSVKIVHDFGQSMNVDIDRGQIEGGLIQGMGWMTIEELIYDGEGKLKSNALSTYKVPDIYFVPKDVTIVALETNGDNMAILKSKAVGEPPLMYGIGAYFAIRNAILAFNKNASIPFSAPITPEKTLMALYSNMGSNQSLVDDRLTTASLA